MDIIFTIFNSVLYQPLFNALILLYDYLPGRDFGIAIIALTLLIRFLLYPLGAQAIKSQKVLSELQPKIKEIQEKYKNEKDKQMKLIMELYKKEKINPFSGCFPILIQLPILIALYQVFWQGLHPEKMLLLYSFVPIPSQISPIFLGLVDLSKPNMVLAFLAGILQYWQTKMTIVKPKNNTAKKSDFASMMQGQMQYFFPVFTVLFLFNLPSAIGIYWVITTLFSIIQQYFTFKKKKSEI